MLRRLDYNIVLSIIGKYSGKVYLPYGNDDYILPIGHKATKTLKAPITVYVGDGSIEGFNSVNVS